MSYCNVIDRFVMERVCWLKCNMQLFGFGVCMCVDCNEPHPYFAYICIKANAERVIHVAL